MACFRRWAGHAAAAWVLGFAGTPAQAISVGAIDTFQDGTTDGWGTGANSNNPPVNIATGGPAGAGDRFLQASATGAGGAGGKLVVFGGPLWLGDYLAAGVTRIEMDLRNFGSTELDLRLNLTSPSAAAISTSAVVLPAGGDWTHVSFDVSVAALSGAPAQALPDVIDFRLFHNPVAVYPGPNIAALLGIDNVSAVAPVPEAATSATWAAGLALLGLAVRRRKRS